MLVRESGFLGGRDPGERKVRVCGCEREGIFGVGEIPASTRCTCVVGDFGGWGRDAGERKARVRGCACGGACRCAVCCALKGRPPTISCVEAASNTSAALLSIEGAVCCALAPVSVRQSDGGEGACVRAGVRAVCCASAPVSVSVSGPLSASAFVSAGPSVSGATLCACLRAFFPARARAALSVALVRARYAFERGGRRSGGKKGQREGGKEGRRKWRMQGRSEGVKEGRRKRGTEE